jgi:hypothetical protein
MPLLPGREKRRENRRRENLRPGAARARVQAAFIPGNAGGQLIHGVLGQLAVGGDLAAEDREHGRAPVAAPSVSKT